MRNWVSMMTSPNGIIFRITGRLCGEFTGHGEFPSHRLVTWSLDIFFDLRLNKRLSKQSKYRWSETPSRSLWRHRSEEIFLTSSNPYIDGLVQGCSISIANRNALGIQQFYTKPSIYDTRNPNKMCTACWIFFSGSSREFSEIRFASFILLLSCQSKFNPCD